MIVERDIIKLPLSRCLARPIIAEVAQSYGLTFDDLVGPAISKAVSHPRHHAMWEVRRRTTLSLPNIGRIFGGRDHSTVLYAVRAHERRRAEAQERAA